MSLNVPFTPGKKPTLLVSAITRGQSLIFKQQLVPSARLRQGSLLRKKVCNRNLSTLSSHQILLKSVTGWYQQIQLFHTYKLAASEYLYNGQSKD